LYDFKVGRKKIPDEIKQKPIAAKVPVEMKARIERLVQELESDESKVVKKLLDLGLKCMDCFSDDLTFLDQYRALPADRQRDLLDQAENLYNRYGVAHDKQQFEADNVADFETLDTPRHSLPLVNPSAPVKMKKDR